MVTVRSYSRVVLEVGTGATLAASDTASDCTTASTAFSQRNDSCGGTFDCPGWFERCRDLKEGNQDNEGDQDNAFGAGYSPEVLMNHVEFWNSLQEDQKAVFARSVEAIPMDAMGGLMQPGKILYQRRRWSLPFWINVARIALNMYVTIMTIYRIELNDERVIFGRHSQHRIEMWVDHVRICDQKFNFTNTNSSAEPSLSTPHSHCLQHSLHRLYSFRYISWFEAIALSLMVAYLAIVWLVFLICPHTCEPLHRTPAAFIILPKITSKFSAISFLQLLNPSRLKAVLFRGEGILTWVLFRHALFPSGCGKKNKSCKRGQDDRADYTSMSREDVEGAQIDDEVAAECSCLFWLFTGVLFVGCVTAIAIGFQDLLAKLTAMHFATMTSFYRWDKHQWMMAVGFLNQMAGICWVDEIELLHIMMFKSGGSDCTWNPTRSRFCAEYMRLVVEKLAGEHGHLHQHHKRHYKKCPGLCFRLKAIAVLANFDARNLQLMLQSPARDGYLDKRREYVLRRLKEYYDDPEVVDKTYYDNEVVDAIGQVRPEFCAKHLKQNEEVFENEFKELSQEEFNGEWKAALKIVKRFSAEQLLRLAESREMVERWSEAERKVEENAKDKGDEQEEDDHYCNVFAIRSSKDV